MKEIGWDHKEVRNEWKLKNTAMNFFSIKRKSKLNHYKNWSIFSFFITKATLRTQVHPYTFINIPYFTFLKNFFKHFTWFFPIFVVSHCYTHISSINVSRHIIHQSHFHLFSVSIKIKFTTFPSTSTANIKNRGSVELSRERGKSKPFSSYYHHSFYCQSNVSSKGNTQKEEGTSYINVIIIVNFIFFFQKKRIRS